MSSPDQPQHLDVDSGENSAPVPQVRPPPAPAVAGEGESWVGETLLMPPLASESPSAAGLPAARPGPPAPGPAAAAGAPAGATAAGETAATAKGSGLPPAPDPFIGRNVGRYRIIDVLGRGGMGVVYEAEDTRIGRKVALKLMPKAVAQDPATMKRFVLEARAAGRLNHPNAVRVFEADIHDGAPYLVMELVRGGSIWQRVKADGPLPWAEATQLLAHVSRAVAEAHRAGLIHRDIKPANILVDHDGRPKLADFGLAKLPVGDTVHNNLTSTSKVIGTPAFMSPEQCQGFPLDGRSDIYSLGMTYYALLTGRPPYDGTVPQMMLSHCMQATPDPRLLQRDIPMPCLDVLSRATAKSPDDRYPDAGKLVQALEHAAEQGNKSSAVLKLEAVSQIVAVKRPAAKPAPRAPLRLPRWTVPLAAALGVGITLLLMWLFLKPKPVPERPREQPVVRPTMPGHETPPQQDTPEQSNER